MKSTVHKLDFELPQLIKAIIATIICGIVIVIACMIKYYVIGQPVTAGIAFCLLTLLISVIIFLGGLLMFAIVSRAFIIRNTRYYVAFLTVISLTFIMHLFLSVITPLLIAPGLTAMIILQLSRRKQDAFIFNLIESVMILSALLFEAIITSGEVYSVIAYGEGLHLWFLVGMTVINIGAGALIPLCLKDKTKRINYIIIAVALACVAVVIFALMGLVYENNNLILKYWYLVLISGIIPLVVSLLINPIIEGLFNLVTDTRLVELSDTKQPLLKRLANEAPGTFNHSLAVANFAEMCAAAVGEDPYLARAAAYYHDVGKLINPSYFAENQAGYNPHDEILPEISAEIIRSHSTEGYKLIKEARIPDEIADVAIEHHGTLPIIVFYERAKKLTDGEVDIYEYSHHGRTPTSKIAAIIMICDSSEAAIRAMDKPDGERVDKLLRSIINDRIQRGQFDKCPISLMDLDIIRQTIINAYGGLFHTRVKYPNGDKN